MADQNTPNLDTDAPVVDPPVDDASLQTPPAQDGDPTNITPPADDGTDGDNPQMIVLTQDEYNRRQAQQKRKVLKEAEEKLEAAQKLQAHVNSLLNGQSIEDVREEMTSLSEQLKSTEQKAAEEAERANNRITSIEQQRDDAIKKYESNLIDRKLFEAIGLKARTESAGKLVQRDLKSRALVKQVGDEEIVLVKAMVEKDGVTSLQEVPPEAAVSLMENDYKEWGYAFKSTVNGGAGGEVVDGVKRTNSGKIDWDAMSENPEKFMELQNKDPNFFDNYFAEQQRRTS